LDIYASINFSRHHPNKKSTKTEFTFKLIFLTVNMSEAPNQAGVSSTSYITYHSGGHLDRMGGVVMVRW
jgi:hypothetical protein